MAQSADLPGGSTGTLSWIDYTTPSEEFGLEENRTHSISYVLSGTELKRTYDESDTSSIVGRNITYLDFTPEYNEDGRLVVNVVITATSPEGPQRSETLEFSVYLRGEGLQ